MVQWCDPWLGRYVGNIRVADPAEGTSALLATAIHAGSAMRPELLARCALSAEERLREEDPFTDRWTAIADNRIIGLRSRFEVDLNRRREKAIYRSSEEAWGLNIWRSPLSDTEMDRSLEEYDRFYTRTGEFVERMLERHARVIIYDLHSYNHQRAGAGIIGDPVQNPEINLGTANLVREAWAPVVERLIASLREPDAGGKTWDVRENVKFRGGYFTQWLNERFGERVCPIAIEFKKTFMDEWTGTPDMQAIVRIKDLLGRSIEPVMRAAYALHTA